MELFKSKKVWFIVIYFKGEQWLKFEEISDQHKQDRHDTRSVWSPTVIMASYLYHVSEKHSDSVTVACGDSSVVITQLW